MDYMTVIWVVVIGAVILSALLIWSVGDTRRHQQRGSRPLPLEDEQDEGKG